jgi:flagellar assembly factor FliW
MVMDLNTSRFGPLRVESEDLLQFPAGLLGMEDCRQWVLLGDAQHPAVAWLQSVERPKVALALVSPRRFVPEYRMRVARAELAPLESDDLSGVQLLVVVGRSDRGITLNLKAPLLIHPGRRLGCQVVTNGELPVRFELNAGPLAWKKTA